MSGRPLVHVRTPAYKRPEALRRCLQSLQAQSWTAWVCDVYDDDPQASGRAVVNALGDPRITYHQNQPQRFASRNIDACFSRDNPRDATYFCVVEDDNFLLPRFMEDNIALCRSRGVEIVFRNQLIEWQSGSETAHLSEAGILDRKFTDGTYAPEVFRMALIADIGVSNGGLFWSRDAVSDLEMHVGCSSTLQEYMRTFAIAEPIHVALEPLAVWAENGEATMRDLGAGRDWQSELMLKKSVALLQRQAWAMAPGADREGFLTHAAFSFPPEQRARGLVKSHIRLNTGDTLGLWQTVKLAFRGLLIRVLGRTEPDLHRFLRARA